MDSVEQSDAGDSVGLLPVGTLTDALGDGSFEVGCDDGPDGVSDGGTVPDDDEGSVDSTGKRDAPIGREVGSGGLDMVNSIGVGSSRVGLRGTDSVLIKPGGRLWLAPLLVPASVNCVEPRDSLGLLPVGTLLGALDGG